MFFLQMAEDDRENYGSTSLMQQKLGYAGVKLF